MKNKIMISAVLATALFSTSASADSLSDALKNGKVSGDVAVTYESREGETNTAGEYFEDTAYSVGSVGLNYETAKYNNFSANIGFRGYTDIWEDQDGDAGQRLDTDERAVLKSAYIAYDTDIAHVKVGRQNISTDWLTHDIDGVTAYITPFEKAELELIYAARRGNIKSRDLVKFSDINGNDGLYQVGFTYAITDGTSAKAYTIKAKDLHDIYGAKLNYDASKNDIGYGGFAHYMSIDQDDTTLEDGNMIDIQAYVDINGWYTYAGYTTMDNNGGWGTAENFGDIITQQEEGDYLYASWGFVANEVKYIGLSKNFAGIDLTLLYSMFDAKIDGSKGSATEFDIWAGYAFNDDFRVDAGFTIVNQDDIFKTAAGTEDLTQLNATFTYTF